MNITHADIPSSSRPAAYASIFLLICLLFLIRCNPAVSSNPSPDDETIRYSEDGIVEFIKGKNLSSSLDNNPQFRELKTENRYGDIAYAFLESRKDILKIQNPRAEFKIISESVDHLGLKHIKFQQIYEEIPVWGKELAVHLDRQNSVYMFQGNSVPTIQDVSTEPRISEQKAAEYAKQKQEASKEKNGWEAKDGKLYVYIVKGSVPRLTYKITLVKGISDKQHYFVDALNGEILHKITGIQHQ